MNGDLRCALLLVLLLCAGLARATEPPQRVVSLNLCTDQILLALLPRERIAMLSQLAADRTLSWAAARAEGIARFDGSVERIVQLDPDLVLTGSQASLSSAAVLKRLGYRVETIAMPETIAASLAFIEQTAILLGEAGAGAELSRDTARRLAAVRTAMAGRPRALGLIYLPNGLSPGAGTLKDELLTLAGWRNLARERGITGYGTLPLEDLVSHSPQAVLFDAVDLEHASLAQQLLRHPALSRHVPSRTVPTASWICGGPQIAEAAEALARLHPHQKRNPQKGDGGIKK
jgi:iron complex transport system substrate-binding protein